MPRIEIPEGSGPDIHRVWMLRPEMAMGAGALADAARRAGEDGVLALKTPGVGQAAAGLHEHQSHALQLGRHPVDIAAQDRR